MIRVVAPGQTDSLPFNTGYGDTIEKSFSLTVTVSNYPNLSGPD